MKFWRSRSDKDAELDAEIRGHIDEAIKHRVARGESLVRQIRSPSQLYRSYYCWQQYTPV